MDDRFKIIRGKLPWSDKGQWVFPSDEFRNRSFKERPGDLDAVIPMLLPLLTRRNTCIQAGGCLGLWPLRLAQFFDQVITFEPDPVNYQCLVENTSDIENISSTHAALGNSTGTVHMQRDEHEVGNCGAYYVVPGGDIPIVNIDDLHVDVDLIYLDIEGYEYHALMGAKDTIRRSRPVIGLEDKNLNARYDGMDAVNMLIDEFGYTIHGRPYRLDIILVP